jgi:alkyldihydroxyacetonephosphate synthase
MNRLSRLLDLGADVAAASAKGLQRLATTVAGPSGPPAGPQPGRIVPGDAPSTVGEEESPDVWGFADTRFLVNRNGNVELSGTRYALAGHELPDLVPWMEGMLQVPIDTREVHASQFPPVVPEPVRNEPFLRAIASLLAPDQRSAAPELRLRHGHGHTQQEMYALKYDRLARVPDLVVHPTEQAQVEALVRLAGEHDVCLIPFGGGTNVTQALRCPEDEQRMIVSVDMRRMNRILWIDPHDRVACIQAGAVGRHIVQQLAEHGFTMGHEPYSVEFSTLGGWIATHASGMKKNRYGNIEDIVLDVNIVTASGTLERSNVGPRESVGTDLRRWIFGSEGNLGIITQAVVKLWPLPEVQRYGSVIFKTFADGVGFLYELTQSGMQPASVRLVDNAQFQMSMTLKPRSEGLAARKSALEKALVTGVLGYDPDQMVACTLVFEGGAAQVAAQEDAVYAIASRHGGMKSGGSNGQRGYQLTFGIAYIRDFIMNHYILAESFETSVRWSQAEAMIAATKARVRSEYAARGLPGRPFITARISQVYETGVCVYFYLAYPYKGVDDPSGVFEALEHAARDEILRQGGSLSHHHGVGKVRQGFLPDIMSPAAAAWGRQTKQAVDPSNIFGARNQLLGEDPVENP